MSLILFWGNTWSDKMSNQKRIGLEGTIKRTPAARELSQRSRDHRAPSCQRKAAKNAGGLSGEGQALLRVQTAKKLPFSLTQNQPPKTGKVAA
jgi:hypothetical protein